MPDMRKTSLELAGGVHLRKSRKRKRNDTKQAGDQLAPSPVRISSSVTLVRWLGESDTCAACET